jgi:hypothetical protein
MLDEQIENLYVLRMGLQEQPIAEQIKLLTLRFLNDKAAETKNDLWEATRKADSRLMAENKRHLAELFSLREELFRKAGGRDDVPPDGLEEAMACFASAPEAAEGGIKAVWDRLRRERLGEDQEEMRTKEDDDRESEEDGDEENGMCIDEPSVLLSNDSLTHLLETLKISDEQKAILLADLPRLNLEERMELLETLRKVRLLDKEEQTSIERLRKLWRHS